MGIADKISDVKKKLEHESKALLGKDSKDKIYSSKNGFENESLAIKNFSKGKERLFNVNLWSQAGGVLNASFELYNKQGNKSISNKPVIGDYLKIDLPGPLPVYWVKVIDIKEEENSAEFTVQPSEDPTTKDSPETQHFFNDQATSTFKLERKGNILIAYEIGKNEIVNSDTEEAGIQAPLNTVVAAGGWAGFQKVQWENLTEYIVGKEGNK